MMQNSLTRKGFFLLSSLLLAVTLLILVLALPATPGVRASVAVDTGSGVWQPTGGPMAPGGRVNALIVHPNMAGTLFAAVSPPGSYDNGPTTIYRSVDEAMSWTAVFTITDRQLYALDSLDTRVYAGGFNPNETGPALFVSDDSGLTWTSVFSFTSRGVWADLQVQPTNPDVALAGGAVYNGIGIPQPIVYGTTDGGLTWTPRLTATHSWGGGIAHDVFIHPLTPTLALAATQDFNTDDTFIYRSVDGGLTWPVSFTLPSATIVELVAHTGQPNLLYAGSAGDAWNWGNNAVYRSEDAGLTWTAVLTDAGGRVAFIPPHTVVAVTDWGAVWRSDADGEVGSWNAVGGVWSPLALAVDDVPAALYVGAYEHGVHQIVDGGVGWQEVNNGMETAVTPIDIALDPHTPGKLFAAADCATGWRSLDDGQTWDQIGNACMGAYAVNPDDPTIVYGGEYNNNRGALTRSSDGGLSFTSVYTAPFIQPDGSGGGENIYAIAIAPTVTSTVYAAGENYPQYNPGHAFIVRSLDDGLTWTELFTLPAQSQVRTLQVSPTDAQVLYAGGQDCHLACAGFVYRSLDGGENWALTLVTTNTVESLVIDPQKPNVLYVADQDYTVYKSVNGGDSWSIIRQPPWLGGLPSGSLLAIDPRVPSHVYLAGWGYIAESVDGGQTWSEWDDPINQGTPPMNPQALQVDGGAVTQTLYAGFNGVWAHTRFAPQPGTPTDIQLWITPTTPVYANGENLLLYQGLVFDGAGNWVADGTPISVTYGTEWEPPFVFVKTTRDGFIRGGWMNVSEPGVVTFTAWANVTTTAVITAEVLYNPPLSVTVTAAPLVLPVGDTAVITVTIPGEHGGVASDGTVVTFTTDLGSIDSPVLVQGGNGQASTMFAAGGAAGLAHITVTTGAVTVPWQIEITLRHLFLPVVIRP